MFLLETPTSIHLSHLNPRSSRLFASHSNTFTVYARATSIWRFYEILEQYLPERGGVVKLCQGGPGSKPSGEKPRSSCTVLRASCAAARRISPTETLRMIPEAPAVETLLALLRNHCKANYCIQHYPTVFAYMFISVLAAVSLLQLLQLQCDALGWGELSKNQKHIRVTVQSWCDQLQSTELQQQHWYHRSRQGNVRVQI